MNVVVLVGNGVLNSAFISCNCFKNIITWEELNELGDNEFIE